MKFKLEIELGSNAMRNSNNVDLALCEVREGVAMYNGDDLFPTGEHVIHDHNGNSVGKWEVISDERLMRERIGNDIMRRLAGMGG